MRKILAAALVAAALIPARAEALENEELLALVAMPLAVAAVSEMTDVPMNELVDVVTLMNDAAVPPAQFIEVVRYAPVALVVESEQPGLSEFVRVQVDQGLRGAALVNSIEDRMRVYGVEGVDLDVTAPRVVDVGPAFFPEVVRLRVAERRAHPHGGPPGQLKKARGVQSGAEIVHGSKPRRDGDGDDGRMTKRRGDDDHPGRGKGRGSGHGGEKDKGKGHGKGHGKGKG